MATISHIPNPISISVKTAGYTIPANRYARVSVNVHAGGTFNIGGVTSLSSLTATWTVLASDNLTAHTLSATSNNGFTNSTIGRLLTGGSNADFPAANFVGNAFNESTAQFNTSVTEQYFMPAGTVINGTGTWRATVEEYGG